MLEPALTAPRPRSSAPLAVSGRPPIALVTRIGQEAEQAWCAALAALLPDERIVAFNALTTAERSGVELAIVANPDPTDIAELPKLAWIHSLWAGVERLVAELGPEAAPIVRLTDPELARTMGEAVLAWTYYLHRDMPAYRQQQQLTTWAPRPYRRPSEVTVGLLGLGALGSAAAERLTGAGFKVLGWSRGPKNLNGVESFFGDEGLSSLLGQSDIVVCLLPLTNRTRHLIDAYHMWAMKPGAALINFGRGPVVVAEDLIAALDHGHISHAVLDVFDLEPLPPASSLWRHPKVTVLPHVSAPTDQASAAAIVAENIRSWRQSGRLPPTIDRRRGY